MRPFIIFHSNDIHGRIEELARIATLVDRARAEHSQGSVLYFDAGDIEEDSAFLSSVTRGIGMHRLLSVAGCQVATVGNGGILRYSDAILPEYAEVARYPLLLANLRREGQVLPGVTSTALIPVAGRQLGIIGVTADFGGVYTRYYEVETVPALPLILQLAAELRKEGADGIVLLSHMGLPADRELAAALQDEVAVIIGAHTHDLLPEGEWVGRVLIVQAEAYAQYLGRLDLAWDAERLTVQRASLLPITDEIEPATRVLSEAKAITREIDAFLGEIIGELAEPLDFAYDRECGVGDLMADVLRERMRADIGVCSVGQAFAGPLPAGPLTRKTLWEVCSSTANPGVATLTGAQLTHLVARGQDAAFAQDRPRPLRGRARGLVHLSGACIRSGQLLIGDRPVVPEAEYRVAGGDWELDVFGRYVLEEWRLHPRYEVPTILREALEDYLAAHHPTHVTVGRVASPLR